MEYIWVVECTEWEEPNLHRTIEGAKEDVELCLRECYKEYSEDEGWHPSFLSAALDYLENSYKSAVESGSSYFCCKTDWCGDFYITRILVED